MLSTLELEKTDAVGACLHQYLRAAALSITPVKIRPKLIKFI